MSNYNNERTLSNKWFKEHNINLPDNVKIIYTDFKVKEEEPEEYEIDIDEFNSLLSGYYLFDDGLKIELIDIEKTIIDALTIKKEVNFDIGNVYDKSKILRNYVTFKIKNK